MTNLATSNGTGRASVTMADVAKVAGVSQTTVSHVMNKTRRINPDTERAVLDAIAATGYYNDGVARSLRTGTTNIIGLAMSAISNPYFGEVVHEIEREATRNGYSLLLADTHDEPGRQGRAVEELLSRRVDAIILAPAADSGPVLDKLALRGVPTVLIDRIPELPTAANFDALAVENVEPMARLTSHLLDLGHRRIALITEPTGIATRTERIRGFRLAFERSGLALDEALIEVADDGERPADQAVKRLFSLAYPPTAIVTGNNRMTIATMESLQPLGLKVPDDVALAVFDDFPWADFFHPRLTAIAQPVHELGQRAMAMLLERLANPGSPPRRARLSPNFVHRESCGCHHDDPTMTPNRASDQSEPK